MLDEEYLRGALRLAEESAASGGGPFGAVIVRDAVVLGTGVNDVVGAADPTAHAEVVAIRDACRRLGTHELTGATVYASCEPCPMCLAAGWWARVDGIVFSADRHQAAAAGFDDAAVYAEVAAPLGERTLPVRQLLAMEGENPFRTWAANASRVPY